MNAGVKSVCIVFGGLALAVGLWALPSPVSRVEKVVREHLHDPDSAQFSKVTHSSLTGTGCGYVNAKNRFGGYAGKTHFMLHAEGKLQFFPTTNVEADEIAYVRLMQERCER